MPSPERVTWAKFRVYSTIAISLCILSVLIYLLTGSGGIMHPRATVRIFVEDAIGLEQGAAVRLNGVQVGKIKSFDLSHDPDLKRSIEVLLDIEERTLPQIPVDSLASVRAETLIAGRYIDIRKGKGAITLRPGGELPAEHPKNAIESRADLVKAFQTQVAVVNALLDDIEAGRGQLGNLAKSEELYSGILSKLNATIRGINRLSSTRETVGSLLYDDSTYRNVEEPVKRLDEQLAAIQRGENAAGHLLRSSEQYDDFDKKAADLRQRFADLRANKFFGTDETHRLMEKRLDQLEDSIDRLNAGESALGHMLVDASAYERWDGAAREMRDLLKEFRTNPKKFLRLKLF